MKENKGLELTNVKKCKGDNKRSKKRIKSEFLPENCLEIKKQL